jgi:NCAIR mutase (PurE)-related protein
MSKAISNQHSQSQAQISQIVQSMIQSHQMTFQSKQQVSHSQVQFSINSDSQTKEIMNATVNNHTQFLRTLKEMKKAFRIDCTVISKTDVSISLRKAITQADQRSEMNVISKALRTQLRLSRNKLTDIDFDELIMRIADHRFTSLKF